MGIKRIFTLLVSMILFVGNAVTTLTNEVLFPVRTVSRSATYCADQDLTAYRGAETQILLTYNNKTDSWLAPTMVSWDNPDSGDTYFVYCADPTYAGYMDSGLTSNNYTLDIKALSDSTALGSGTSTAVSYVDGIQIRTALEGAVNYGYPTRDSLDIFEEVVGTGASALSGVSQDQLNYAAYLATKIAIWSIVSTNHTMAMWETSTSSNGYTTAFKEATLAVAHSIYNKALTYVRPTFDPDSIGFSFAEPVQSGDEYIVTGNIEDRDGLVNDADIRVFMNDGSTFASNEITVDGGRLSADGLMYYVPASNQIALRMAKPTTDEYDITKDIGIFLTRGPL